MQARTRKPRKEHEQTTSVNLCFFLPVVSILVEAAAAGEDDESHLCITKNRQLIGLFQQPISALAEGDLPVCGVLDPLDFDLAPTHFPLRGHLSGLITLEFHS